MGPGWKHFRRPLRSGGPGARGRRGWRRMTQARWARAEGPQSPHGGPGLPSRTPVGRPVPNTGSTTRSSRGSALRPATLTSAESARQRVVRLFESPSALLRGPCPTGRRGTGHRRASQRELGRGVDGRPPTKRPRSRDYDEPAVRGAGNGRRSQPRPQHEKFGSRNFAC